MPKLAAKERKRTEKVEAAGGGFDPIEPGKYIATLNQVEAKNSANGNPMWVAEFGEMTNSDGDVQPGRQWYNLNLPTTDDAPDGYEKGQEKWTQYQNLCRGRIKGFFEAFGYDLDSDTDEMVGERCVIQIGIRTIQNGARAGEQTNEVRGIQSLDSVPWASEVGGDDGDDTDEF